MANSEQQQSLNELLKWSVENSDATRNDPNAPTPQDPSKGLNKQALAELFGAPSDADRMRQAMTAIIAPADQVDLENKIIAWDNLEQLIEQIDNANNLESLGMWPLLVQQLSNQEAEMRKGAAAVMGTAVQNNIKAQEKLLEHGALPALAKIAVEDEDKATRKKAVSALSSEIRNFQPGLEELEKCIPSELWAGPRGLDAGDMEGVDEVVQKLRVHAARP